MIIYVAKCRKENHKNAAKILCLNKTTSGLYIFYFVTFLFLACGQNTSITKKVNRDSIQPNKIDTAAGTRFSIDTNKIAILSSEKIDFFGLKDSIPAKLTNADLILIDTFLTSSVRDHNSGIDSTKLYEDYIDLKKYKRQYVPYINSNGEKIVFINCFCNGIDNSDTWKKKLLVVEDGGRCFFAVIINVTKQLYHQLLINGPG
jgi:hypothetical protein